MPVLIIFQLYQGNHFNHRWKLEYQEKYTIIQKLAKSMHVHVISGKSEKLVTKTVTLNHLHTISNRDILLVGNFLAILILSIDRITQSMILAITSSWP